MTSMTYPLWFDSYVMPFISLSYVTSPPDEPDSFPDSRYYNTGPLDACLVFTCIVVMAILRDVLRLWVCEPFARWKLRRDFIHAMDRKTNGSSGVSGHARTGQMNGNGHSSQGEKYRISPARARVMHRSVLRFAEQGWSVVYYTTQWCFGLYVHINLPTEMFQPVSVWINYPHIPLPGAVKFYYLSQTAFYMHQIFILNAEARRKDHYQMMTHHIITIFLMGGSYFLNFTRVGCLVMVLMDWCDIFLPLAKMLRYLSYRTACDYTFSFFLISWFITRHVLFLIPIYSACFGVPPSVPYAWIPEKGFYRSKPSWTVFCTLLVLLQVLQIGWFWMICRVAWRVVRGQGADDDRSDDEGDNDQKEE